MIIPEPRPAASLEDNKAPIDTYTTTTVVSVSVPPMIAILSADNRQALETFCRTLPQKAGLAFIVVTPSSTTPASLPMAVTDHSLAARVTEELLHTSARLQSLIAEYEASNQELKAANEELQAINQGLLTTTAVLATNQELLQAQCNQAEAQLTFPNSLLDYAYDAVIATDAELNITAWNRGAETMYGWQASEVLGRKAPEVTQSSMSPAARTTALQQLTEQGRFCVEVMTHHRDGTPIWVEGHTVAVYAADGAISGYMSISRDIRERKQVEQRLHFLTETSTLLASSLDITATLQHVAQAAVPGIADWCVIDLVAADGSFPKGIFAHVDPTKVQWAEALRERYPIDPQAPFGAPYVIKTGQSELYSEISDEMLQMVTKNAEELALLRAVGYQSAMIVPLQTHGRILGALTFVSTRAERHFTAVDLSMAEELAQRAAAAIGNAQLHQAVQQREQALRSSEERLRLATEAGKIGIFDCDLLTGEIILSDIYRAITGVQADVQLTWEEWIQRVHPDDRPLVVKQLQKALTQGQSYSYQYRLYRPDGEVRWLAINNQVSLDDSGRPVRLTGVMRDITEQKQTESDRSLLTNLAEQVRQVDNADQLASAVVRLVGEHLQVGRCLLIELDEARDYGYIRHQYYHGLPPVAPTYQQSTYSAMTRAELVAGHSLINHDVEHDPRTAEIYATVYDPQDERAFVGIPCFHEGVWRGILSVTSATPRQWQPREVQLLEAVAERLWFAIEKLKLDAELRLREARYRTLVEAAPIFVWHTDAAGNLTYSSDRYYAYTGLQAGADTGWGWQTQPVVHPDDLSTLMSRWQHSLATGERFEMEVRLRGADGVYRWHLNRMLPTLAADQQIQGWVGTSTNIDEQRRAETELRVANAVLEQRVRERTAELERSNGELERFAYIASHDLRAPLRAIMNLANWIEEDAGVLLPTTSREHLQKLRGRTLRMERLLDELLTYARIGRKAIVAEEVKTENLIQDILYLLAPPTGFTVIITGELPVLRTPRTPLELVLRNLINNAIKHHHQPTQGRVHIAVQDLGDRVEFAVNDNGPGIDPQFHERIFGMFQTLRPRDDVEGGGMGLAIVKRAVEYYGGVIQVESTLGAGTTFRFTWPKQMAALAGRG